MCMQQIEKPRHMDFHSRSYDKMSLFTLLITTINILTFIYVYEWVSLMKGDDMLGDESLIYLCDDMLF